MNSIEVLQRCLQEANGDTEAALVAAEYIISNNIELSSTQPTSKPITDSYVTDNPISAFFAYDIKNRKAQGILNQSIKASKELTNQTKKDLIAALDKPPSKRGGAILNVIRKHHIDLTNILSHTQLSSVLEGATTVASKVPVLELDSSLLGNIPQPTFHVEEGPLSDNITKSAQQLASKNVLDQTKYVSLKNASRSKAHTVVGVGSKEALEKIKDVISNHIDKGTDHETIKQEILSAVDQGTLLSEAYQEVLLRANIQSAFSDGQMAVLNNPLVYDRFPYSSYNAIHDHRSREDHLALEKLGIDGSNVYRNDDPVFHIFRPPWDFGDRCSWTPLTIRQAAQAGVQEAKQWIEDGTPPADPTYVDHPPFQPSPTFQRIENEIPLSIKLSLQSVLSFSNTVNQTNKDYPRDSANRFIDPKRIVEAAQDATKLNKLLDSLLDDGEDYKLHSAISTLQSGGTIHHPNDPPELGIDIHGIIPDPEWSYYAYQLEEHKNYKSREANRIERGKIADAFIKSVRSSNPYNKSTKLLIAVHEQHDDIPIKELRLLLDEVQELYSNYVSSIKYSLNFFEGIDTERRLIDRTDYNSTQKIRHCIESYILQVRKLEDTASKFDSLLSVTESAYSSMCDICEGVAERIHSSIEEERSKESYIPEIPKKPTTPPSSVAFGLVEGEWHGRNPPNWGKWSATAPGPRGGKRWRKIDDNTSTDQSITDNRERSRSNGIGLRGTNRSSDSGTDRDEQINNRGTSDTRGDTQTVPEPLEEEEETVENTLNPQIVTARSEPTVKPSIWKVDGSLHKHLISPNGLDHQLQGAAMAVNAIDTVGGFLLADGAGSGKTRQLLAVAKTYANRGKKALIVAPAGIIKPDWKSNAISGSVGKDGSAMRIDLRLNRGDLNIKAGEVHVTTYESLEDIKDKVDSDTVVLFDEVHGLKNARSARAIHGKDIISKSMGVVYGSATPADNVMDISYLFRTKLFGDEPWESVRKRFSIKKFGATEVLGNVSNIFDKLTKDGVMIKREISLDGITAHFDHVKLPTEDKQLLELMKEATSPSNRAQLLMRQRFAQEKLKIPHTVNMIKDELSQNRQVVIFVAGVSGEGEELGTAGMLRSALEQAGISPNEVAELHGGEGGGGREVVESFQKGNAKVLITTAQSGGTGHNLDDTVGNAPRTQIIMTAPFSAIDNSQIWGRTHRLTTRSPSNIRYVFADTEIDKWNANLIKNKMKTMHAIVGGESEKQGIDTEITLGLVDGEWHGRVPPNWGKWTPIEPGPRGGKRWKKVIQGDSSGSNRSRRRDNVITHDGSSGGMEQPPGRSDHTESTRNRSDTDKPVSDKTNRSEEQEARERISRMNKRLDSYKKYFLKVKYSDAANWVDDLRNHIENVGIDTSLDSLVDEKSGEDKRVQYKGTGKFNDLNKEQSKELDFIKTYLDNVGITFLPANTRSRKIPLIASAPVPSVIKSQQEDDIVATETNLAHKLAESKYLPGLESAESIHKIIGHKVDQITTDVMNKLDDTYGKNKWVIKNYGGESYAGFGIFFPQRLKEIKRLSKQVMWETSKQLEELGYLLHRDGKEVTGIKDKNTGTIYKFDSEKYSELPIDSKVKKLANVVMATAPSEHGARLPNTSEDSLRQDFGLTLVKDNKNNVIGLIDDDGSYVKRNSKKWMEIEEWDEKIGQNTLSRSILMAGFGEFDAGAEFLVQPAFKSKEITEADRARGVTWETGREGRVHATTQNGKVSIVPYATMKSRRHPFPAVFYDDDVREMEKVVQQAINRLPRSERKGQIYAPDVMKTTDGWKVIELNVSVGGAQSEWLQKNPFVIDAFVSHLTNRDPAHVRFIRDILKDKKPHKTGGISASIDAHGREHAPAGSSRGGQFISRKTKDTSKLSIVHSKATIKLDKSTGITEELANKAARKLLGKNRSIQDFASVVGAPDEAIVKVGILDKWYGEDGIDISVRHKYYEAEREIRIDDNGKTWIHNTGFYMKPGFEGSGLGSQIFHNQVTSASSMGISSIYTWGSSGLTIDGTMQLNGYYTWPRLGYNAPINNNHISNNTVKKIKKEFPNARTIRDLINTKHGRKWWKENGSNIFDLKFDLSPNSKSMSILKAYMDKRK